MANFPELVLTDSLGVETRNIIELAKLYDTIILIYSDEFSDRILASWAELDRLNLPTHRVGQVYSGIEIHTFGLDPFPDGTVLDLHVREVDRSSRTQDVPDSRRTAYRSLLNELCTISVQVRQRAMEPDFLNAFS